MDESWLPEESASRRLNYTDRGIAKATQGIYHRNLRAIFNEAIAHGIISKEKGYPFGRRKYQIPIGRNIKKALKLEQIETIYFNETVCKNERRAKAYWLFLRSSRVMGIMSPIKRC
jgi:integrase/recombinase XerD